MGVATYSSWQLWDVMPYMVNGSLFYGNIIYMMSEGAYERLTPRAAEHRDGSRGRDRSLAPAALPRPGSTSASATP